MYSRRSELATAVAACLLASGAAVGADFGSAKWTYERLFKDSDVVVIVKLESTRETNELLNKGNDAFLKEHNSDAEVRVVVSKLTCEFVLKGEVKDKVIEFRHWHPKRGESHDDIPDPARLGRRKKYQQDDTLIVRELEYMLFLRRTKDHQFEPASSIIGARYSVRELLHLPAGNLVDPTRDK